MDHDFINLMKPLARTAFTELSDIQIFSLYIYTKAGLTGFALEKNPHLAVFFEDLPDDGKRMYDFAFEILKTEAEKRLQ